MRVEAERARHSDDQQLHATLDTLCTDYAVELKRSVPQQEGKP